MIVLGRHRPRRRLEIKRLGRRCDALPRFQIGYDRKEESDGNGSAAVRERRSMLE
jgi:hypothetical protein